VTIERGTHRDRKLLDLAHEAPCMLGLPDGRGCGIQFSVPCHSDLLRHGRGVGHKSHDCLAVPGCPECHARFTREHLGDRYEATWLAAMERYLVWLWRNGKVKVA
jgi:hypothetical protein